MPGLATREPRLTMPPGGVPGAAVEERNDAPAHSATTTAPITAIRVPDRALDVGLRLAGVATLAFGERAGVGVIEVKVVGNLIPLTLLPEVAISRVF